jgi:hypothetical protein
MTPEPPLEYMLDQPSGPPAGRDELAAIVARSSRRRTRMAAAGMAGTLLVGAVGGWAIASQSKSDNRVMASATSPTTIGPEAGAAYASGGGVSGVISSGGPGMKRTFVRTTADGVTVRGFEMTPPDVPAAAKPCLVFPVFQSELSTTGMASGSPFPVFDTSGPLSGSVGLIGQAEQSPVWVATTHSGTGITLVRAHFSDGSTDEMAPVNGWAVLAHGAATAAAKTGPATATVEGLDGQGKVVATQQLDEGGKQNFKPPAGCVPPPLVCPPPAGQASPGNAPPTGNASPATKTPPPTGNASPATKTPPPTDTRPPVESKCAVIQQGSSSAGSAGGGPAAPAVTSVPGPPAT